MHALEDTNMKKEIPKKIKRLLRDQMGKAYEEEIRRAFLPKFLSTSQR
jgi:hypothetical protein